MAQLSRLKDAEISNGNAINADDLDDEFDQLVTESNSQDTRLTNLESNAMTIAGVKTFSSAPLTNQIDERTAASGVTIDSVLCKDGQVTVTGDPSAALQVVPLRVVSKYIQSAPPVYATAATFTVASFSVADSTGAAVIRKTDSTTVNISTSGAGGLDTGTEANSTWYYLYAIGKTDGTAHLILSVTNEVASGSITLPSGYTLKRQLPFAVYNNSSGNILPFYIAYGWPYRPLVMYRDNEKDASPYRVLTNGTATSFTAVTALVPAISRVAILDTDLGSTFAASSTTTYLRETGSGLSTGRAVALGSNLNIAAFHNVGIVQSLDTSQQFDYKQSSSSNGVDIMTAGFIVTEVV